MALYQKRPPETVKIGALYDTLTRFVEKYDGGTGVYFRDAEGELRLIEGAFLSEEGGFKIVLVEKGR